MWSGSPRRRWIAPSGAGHEHNHLILVVSQGSETCTGWDATSGENVSSPQWNQLPTCWKQLKVANRRTTAIDFCYCEYMREALALKACVCVSGCRHCGASRPPPWPWPQSPVPSNHTLTHTQLQWPVPGVETQSQWAAVRKLPAQQGFVFFPWLHRHPVEGPSVCLSVRPTVVCLRWAADIWLHATVSGCF